MASFDFVKATLDGYRFAWVRRADLIKFSIPVVFVSVFCNLMVIYTGAEENALREGLILLPAFFAQGLFVAELVRYTLYDEPFILWGYTRRSHLEEFTELYRERQLDTERKRHVQGGMVIFVLVSIINSVLRGLSGPLAEGGEDSPASSPALEDFPVFVFQSAIVAVILLVALWFVRVGFLYIGFSAGYGIKAYFKKLKGLSSSVSLFLCAFMIFFLMAVPLALMYGFLGQLLAESPGIKVVSLVVFGEMSKVLAQVVTTIGCSYGVREMMEVNSRSRLD